MHSQNRTCPKCQMTGELEWGEAESPGLGEVYGELAFEPEQFLGWFEKPKPAVARKGVAAAFAPVVQKVAAQAKLGIPPEKVCWIQNVLNKTQAENLVPDGIYGPLSRDAVRRFQSRHGLSVDGIVGSQTETALIQAALNEIAQASLLPVNGVMDARTRQEIVEFQSRNNLVADGIVGPKTRAAMVIAMGGQCLVRRSNRGPAQYYQVPPTCNKPAYDRQLGLCNDDAERCLRNALEDLGVKVGLGCLAGLVAGLVRGGLPAALAALAACGIAASGALILALKRCDEALNRCRELAQQQTGCT